MTDWQLQTPVAFLIFNRPDTTARVFAEICRARPPKLLVVADGPRPDRVGEAEKVAATRAIVEQVDWPCEVLKNYSDINLGCRRRVSSGLDWVFQTVEEAIILEDDCLPHPTFFRFCEELLEKYRNDERVMHINGSNYQFGRKCGEASYYFSHYTHIWGWASWRWAWRHYDVDIKNWTALKNKDEFLWIFSCRAERIFWRAMWDKVAAGKIDTWDYQWSFACLTQNALGIAPNVNLISNIGFGSDSTHTTGVSMIADMPTVAMEFPLVHPRVFIWDDEADEHTGKLFFRMPNIIKRVVARVKCIVFNRMHLYMKCIGGWRNAL